MKNLKKRIKKLKDKKHKLEALIYQQQANMIIEYLKICNSLELWFMWDYLFIMGVSLDFNMKEKNIYLK